MFFSIKQQGETRTEKRLKEKAHKARTSQVVVRHVLRTKYRVASSKVKAHTARTYQVVVEYVLRTKQRVARRVASSK